MEFDAGTLPCAFIGSAFIVPVMGLLFGELEQRLPVTRLFHITLSFIFGSILVSWVLLITFDNKLLVSGIFIWAHVIFVLCYLDAIKNSNLDSNKVEDISDATLPKSYQKINSEPYYLKLKSYHIKYFGWIFGWIFPFASKWVLSFVRKNMLRLVICRVQKTAL
ncbi:MAG: hypothetical protein ISR86_01995 [Nitrospinaceae bacterium]|nr:hypothetical protein [Nitrospinaceae bacterium]